MLSSYWNVASCFGVEFRWWQVFCRAMLLQKRRYAIPRVCLSVCGIRYACSVWVSLSVKKWHIRLRVDRAIDVTKSRRQTKDAGVCWRTFNLIRRLRAILGLGAQLIIAGRAAASEAWTASSRSLIGSHRISLRPRDPLRPTSSVYRLFPPRLSATGDDGDLAAASLRLVGRCPARPRPARQGKARAIAEQRRWRLLEKRRRAALRAVSVVRCAALGIILSLCFRISISSRNVSGHSTPTDCCIHFHSSVADLYTINSAMQSGVSLVPDLRVAYSNVHSVKCVFWQSRLLTLIGRERTPSAL